MRYLRTLTRMLTTREPARRAPAISLTSDPVLAADGSIWSQAATLGTRVQGGDEFSIDRATIANFLKVFSSGYPQKIPVDYEHGSTTGDAEVRKLRAQGMVPKAGDVLELRGVYAPSEFTGDLKAAAEKLAANAGRPLDDPRNLGLWARWKPTARALQSIKAGEYTELSIAFDTDLPNNTTGEGQGPALVAIALCNLPFLDDMLPVAATRGGAAPAVDPAQPHHEEHMTKLTLLSVAAALLGKAPTSDDDALAELNRLGEPLTELKATREFRDVVAAEFDGEKDPVKLAAKVRELKANVKAANDAAAATKKAAIKTTVDATMKQYEKSLTVPLREMMVRGLTKELEEGVELEKTEALKALKSLGGTGITTQRSAADVGGANSDDDDKLEARARELMTSDAEVQELTKRDRQEGYKLALRKADRELMAAAQ